MSNSTIAVIALLLVGAICTAIWVSRSTTKESFWNGPARTVRVDRETSNDGGISFFQTPGYQPALTPRFGNNVLGPYIRRSLPAYNTFAVPSDPLGFGDGDTCGFRPGRRPQTGCEKFMDDEPVNVGEPSFQDDNEDGGESSCFGPEHAPCSSSNDGDDNSFLNADGEMTQPIVYDRFIYANRSSRLRAMGDPIRGDLPIVPITGNWFTPNVHPNIDLQPGSMNVLGGVSNETNHQLASLIYASSGGSQTTIGGLDFSTIDMSSRYQPETMSAGGDVIVTSFP